MLKSWKRLYSTLPTATTSTSSFSAHFNRHGTGGRSSSSGKIVTVFGATGFLGRYVVNELGKEGTQVVVPYRGSPDDVRHLKVMGDLGQIVFLRADVRDEQSIRDVVKYSDVVINLIGRDYETRNFNFEQVHVDAARMIAKVSKEAGVKRLIHVSAMNADPKQEGSQFLSSKGKGERSVSYYFPEAIIVRPSDMYGWEDRLFQYLGTVSFHKLKRWFTLGFYPLLNGGKRTFHPVYVGDVARGIKAIVDAEQPQQLYEFLGPERFTWTEFVSLFCEYARKPFYPLSVSHSFFRSIISWTQLNPLAKKTVHDVDRQVISDKVTPGVAGLSDLGVQPERVEDLAIRFVRHFRTEHWVEQPATFSETKLWEKAQPRN